LHGITWLAKFIETKSIQAPHQGSGRKFIRTSFINPFWSLLLLIMAQAYITTMHQYVILWGKHDRFCGLWNHHPTVYMPTEEHIHIR